MVICTCCLLFICLRKRYIYNPLIINELISVEHEHFFRGTFFRDILTPFGCPFHKKKASKARLIFVKANHSIGVPKTGISRDAVILLTR